MPFWRSFPISTHFTPANPDRASRAGALDILRFLAAAFIVLYHFGSSAPVDLTATYGFLDRGWLATDFFIILSGYVLGRAYGSRLDSLSMSPQTFVLKRVARVWPAHLIVLFGLGALVLVAGLIGLPSDAPERFQIGDFLSQAFLVHAWGMGVQPSWNEPSWTLSALVVCYALFPILWLASRPLRGSGWALPIGVSVVGAAALLSQQLLGASLYDLPFHQGVLRAVPLFTFGTLLAAFTQGRRFSRAAALASALASFGALIAVQAPERSELSALVSIIALATIIVSVDGLALKRTPAIKAVADVSFALFITHAVIGTVWLNLMSVLGLGSSWWTWFGAWAAVLIGAVGFHHLIDRPIQRRLNALLDRRRTPRGELAADGA